MGGQLNRAAYSLHQYIQFMMVVFIALNESWLENGVEK